MGEPVVIKEFPMLLKCADERVFEFERSDDGRIVISECCDGWFGFQISPEEMRRLGEEIIALASRLTPKESGGR